MSLSHSLSNALSGMTATSRLAEIVSSNVANAMTEGYGRRELELSAATVGGRGAGVQTGAVIRVIDKGILAEQRLANAENAALGSKSERLAYLEDLLGTADDAHSIAARVNNVEQALIDAASDPSSDVRLGLVMNRMSDLAGALNTASDSIQRMRQEADGQIAADIDTLNTSLRQVEKLNADITASRNTGNDPSALMDQRQVIIDQISEIVPIRELSRPAGQVALMTTAGEMLVDGPAKQFEFAPSNVVTADMTFGGGGLAGLTVSGAVLSATDGVGRLAGGRLGAAFEARDSTLVEAQAGLDALAADLIQRLQDSSVDPTLGAGDPGLFTDAGGALDVTNIVGLAGRVQVSAQVDPNAGGALWRLRDGLNATTQGPMGNSSMLEALTDALAAAQPLQTGGAIRSFSAHAGDFQSRNSAARLDAQEDLSFASARLVSLTDAAAADGVDTDYEMQMLLRIERSYAANARLIQTVESMLSQLMEL